MQERKHGHIPSAIERRQIEKDQRNCFVQGKCFRSPDFVDLQDSRKNWSEVYASRERSRNTTVLVNLNLPSGTEMFCENPDQLPSTQYSRHVRRVAPKS